MAETRLVAYIDILGFSEAVKQANDTEYNDIENLLRTISQYKRDFKINDTGAFPPLHMGIMDAKEGREIGEKIPLEVLDKLEYSSDPAITNFSDHVVISEPISLSGEDFDFISTCVCGNITNAISRFGYLCLLNGFLIRGAIVAGKFTHDQNVVFGVPLITADKLEKAANFPRILVDESANFITKLDFYNLDNYCTDVDNKSYFDWLGNSPALYLNHQFPPNHPDEPTHMFNCLGNIITKKLRHYKSYSGNSEDDYKIYEKWKWFAIRFNSTAQNTIGSHYDRAVDFEPVIID